MATSSAPYSQLPKDSEIWANLQAAISKSSGFERWKQEQGQDTKDGELEPLVRSYLRDTLETLAY